MKQAVGFRLSDTSTLVREAAVDLIGRFVLSRPDLTDKYYDMIAERIRVSWCNMIMSSAENQLLYPGFHGWALIFHYKFYSRMAATWQYPSII